MPIFSFGLIVKDTFLSTRGRFSRYRISAFSKTTSPSCGQSRGGVLFLIRAGASRESVFKTKPEVQFPVNKTLERKIISCSFQQEFFPADSAHISLWQFYDELCGWIRAQWFRSLLCYTDHTAIPLLLPQ